MTLDFRACLHAGRPLAGTLLSLPSPDVAEILARAGFDWFFVDLEHSPLDPREAQELVRAAGQEVACVLRVPLNDEIWIKKALDTGCAGVMVPQVNTAEDARRAVRYSKYPPQGTRSIGIGRAHGYGALLQEYIERANRETAVVIQAEHVTAVANIESILDVDGVDAVLVGPYDLSASLGLIGQVTHPAVQAAIATVREACLKRGMPLGIFTASAESGARYIQEGFTLVAAGADISMLDHAARAVREKLGK